MRIICLGLCLVLLSACAPKAWTKTGYSLEQGDGQLELCEAEGDMNIPKLGFFDVSVHLSVHNAYYDTAQVRSELTRRLQAEANTVLRNKRQEDIQTYATTCMVENGWTQIEDPR